MTREAESFASAVALRAALAALGRRLRAQDAPGGVGSTGLSLLGRLYRDGPATASALAFAERLQPQSLTRTLQAMEARGLIARSTDDADRRRSTIAITGNGIALLRESVAQREAWLAEAIDSTLSATERDLLRLSVGLLNRLAAAGK